MSKQEEANETLNVESKQLIGSSKRKRKSSSIKHNVLNNEKSDSNEVATSQKPVRTYSKKSKTDKLRNVKIKAEPSVNTNNEMCKAVNNKESLEGDMQAGLESGNNDLNEVHVNLKMENQKKTGADSQEPESKEKEKITLDSSAESGQCTDKEQCQNCTFCTEHKSGIEKDVKVDVSSKMFTCKICSGFGLKRVYSSQEKLKRHTKEVHEPKKEMNRFECTDCPEPTWFPTKSKFCYHLGAKHPGIIKFVCEVCTQTFKLKANYKNHIKTHNIVVQKKFSCDVCGGTFVNRAGFEAHKKRFPGPHIKQSCTHCGISFSKEKHLKNHRCKILLLEELAAARENSKNIALDKSDVDAKLDEEIQTSETEKKMTSKEDEESMEPDSTKKDVDPQTGKKVLFHRLLPKKNEKVIYRQFPLPAQNVPQSVVVQEFREIDLEGGAFIAAEPEHQIILRDVNGHLVQGNQILQLDINEFQPGEDSQVYLADWNVVAPFVIRGKSP